MYVWSVGDSSFPHKNKILQTEDFLPFFLRSLNSDILKFSNGLDTKNPISIALFTTACFNTGFGPISGTDFALFIPRAVGVQSDFNRFPPPSF